MLPTILAPSVPEGFEKRLYNFDPALKVMFNCDTERWELYRCVGGRMHWILAIENEDESYRPLDDRIFKKLYEMDIIARWGSIDNYDKHLDAKQKKWQDDRQKEMDHQFYSDIRADKHLWQKAAENARSGIINDPPEQKGRKVISVP